MHSRSIVPGNLAEGFLVTGLGSGGQAVDACKPSCYVNGVQSQGLCMSVSRSSQMLSFLGRHFWSLYLPWHLRSVVGLGASTCLRGSEVSRLRAALCDANLVQSLGASCLVFSFWLVAPAGMALKYPPPPPTTLLTCGSGWGIRLRQLWCGGL